MDIVWAPRYGLQGSQGLGYPSRVLDTSRGQSRGLQFSVLHESLFNALGPRAYTWLGHESSIFRRLVDSQGRRQTSGVRRGEHAGVYK